MLYHNVDPLHLFDYIHGGMHQWGLSTFLHLHWFTKCACALLSLHDIGLNIEEIIRPNPELRKLLLQMKGGIKKWVFSNADMTHCLRVIKVC